VKRLFFIFCLPRSGSAWLSLFLSGNDSFCFHDPLGDQGALTERMYNRKESVVGAIDSGAYRMSAAIQTALPCARYFVLRRDPQEIQRSSDKFGVKFNAVQESSILDGLEHLQLYSSMFGDLDYLEFLWRMITELPFDRERAKIMSEMRVERDVYRYFSNRPHLPNPLRASWN
jgi:hypothetical protein